MLATVRSRIIREPPAGRAHSAAPPNSAYDKDIVPFGAMALAQMQMVAFVGAESAVAEGLREFVDAAKADELIAMSQIC